VQVFIIITIVKMESVIIKVRCLMDILNSRTIVPLFTKKILLSKFSVGFTQFPNEFFPHFLKYIKLNYFVHCLINLSGLNPKSLHNKILSLFLYFQHLKTFKKYMKNLIPKNNSFQFRYLNFLTPPDLVAKLCFYSPLKSHLIK